MIRGIVLVVLLVALQGILGCGGNGGSLPEEDVFESRGLAGLTVVGFVENESTVLAATDAGIHRYDGGNSWTRTTPENWSVVAIEALYPSQIMAFVDDGGAYGRLVESLDGGNSWHAVEHDFGGSGEAGPCDPVRRLRFNDRSGELFATGNAVVAVSADFGRTWSVIDGDWCGLASGLSALTWVQDTQSLWFGGQNAIEDPVLKRMDYATLNVADRSATARDTLGRPSTIKNVVRAMLDGPLLFATGEGGIMRSADDGQSWEVSIANDDARFYFDLAVDARTGTIYTAGWNKDFTSPQPLIVEASTDGGRTWMPYRHADERLLGGVWSLRLFDDGGRSRLFLGLQGGGVYEADLDRLDG
ncbi:WD40/YVTN/BNR-like repeat-containing protein [Sinimarinibacterium flocculans]|uniref:WD40/YVTN/BNR-like repeat-containing protein n=1 Tax=Sinimarinibacterium flocculans TaxID=985250 RepID=UPI0035161391